MSFSTAPIPTTVSRTSNALVSTPLLCLSLSSSSLSPSSSSLSPSAMDQTHAPSLQRSPRSLMSLPDECLVLLVQRVANLGIQELYPLLCVNRRFFYLVVPILYRDPFRLSARWVWKRTVYKSVIERQTKLIRTLLLCCTRTIDRITPIDPEANNDSNKNKNQNNSNNNNNINHNKSNNNNNSNTITTTTRKPGPALSSLGRAITAAVRRGDKETSVDTAHHAGASVRRSDRETGTAVGVADGASAPLPLSPLSRASAISDDVSSRVMADMVEQGTGQKAGDRSILRSLFHKLGSGHRPRHTAGDNSRAKGLPLDRIEKVPIIWDGERHQPETRRIPGLGRPNSEKLKFPPELSKTVIRLASESPPMVNYLSYVTNTEVREWSVALNMNLVHQILGDARPSWHVRLQGFVKRTSRRIMGKHPGSDRHGGQYGGASPMSDTRRELDDFDDDDEDGLDTSFSLRHGSRFRRWRRSRTKRNKNLWELRDVDFLELLFLFYTSARMETLSLAMNCSNWYHPSLNVLLPGIPERLSGLRRLVINHADSVAHKAVPIPQLFIQRHQKAFPGQLREIQVRQSYHYSHDMSKAVLQTIKTMERLEVLDLSIWAGVFSGLESICMDHLRKLLICHHMDVPRPDMFDELVKRCPVLEDLSIIVPHPHLFSWAAERRSAVRSALITATPGSVTKSHPRQSLFSLPMGSLWSDTRDRLPVNLPPLKNLILFGHTPDVVGAFKDVIFAFQDTLESIQVSMYSDMTKPPDTHFDVPPPHFAVSDGNLQPSYFGVSLLQDTIQSSTSTFNSTPAASAAPQSTLDPFNASSELSSLWLPGILAGIHGGQDPSSSSSCSNDSSTTSPPTPPAYLTWSWPLPRLRTMSLRGPAVAYFDLQVLQFCPQLTDLALSYHCSRLPRLVYPGPTVNKHGPVNTVPRYPRIMMCDSLAFKWGISLQEDRRSLVIV